jgi:hypothetical protein
VTRRLPFAFALAFAFSFPFTSAFASPLKVAITPLKETPDAAALERALVDAMKDLSGVQLVNAGPNGRLSPKAAGADRVLNVEAARLVDGRVLYLQGLDASGKLVASTNVPLAKDAGEVQPGDRPALRAALVRALEPSRYLGKLQLKVDVAGAELQVDGKRIDGAATQVVELPVGTHALRVTHPAYRDFLRFVDVEYDKTLALDVPMSAYPLAEGEMSERMRKAGKKRAVPWWRSWWALSLTGVVITGVVAGAVIGSRPPVTFDQNATYVPSQGP